MLHGRLVWFLSRSMPRCCYHSLILELYIVSDFRGMLSYTAIRFTENSAFLQIISFLLFVHITRVIIKTTLLHLVFLFYFLESNTVIYALFNGEYRVHYLLKSYWDD